MEGGGVVQQKIIDSIDVYVKSRSVMVGEPCNGGVVIEEVMNYTSPARIDLQLPVDVVDYYRVFPEPPVTEIFKQEIGEVGIQQPLRIYVNGRKGVLRDGHHRLKVAKDLGLDLLPVHVVPNWLERTYVDYELPDLEEHLTSWLADNLDFTHTGHKIRRTEANKRVTQAYCECGAHWRETKHEPWEHILGGPKR
jgi:hypothetical protein